MTKILSKVAVEKNTSLNVIKSNYKEKKVKHMQWWHLGKFPFKVREKENDLSLKTFLGFSWSDLFY